MVYYPTRMYLIRIIPISRGITKDELTYFSAVPYEPGSIVLVMVRSRNVPGLVIGNEPVRDAKSTVRTASFALKKLRKQTPLQIISPAFVRAAEKSAEYHASSVGAILYTFLPHSIVRDPKGFTSSEVAPPLKVERGFVVPHIFQGPYLRRVDLYKTSVRAAFARRESVLLVTPSIVEAERLHREISPGINEYVHILHTALTSKALLASYTAALKDSHPVLVICTQSFLSLPRHDLKTIIVEREASTLYRNRTRPFTDTRILAHELAAYVNGSLILADLPLRIESFQRRESGEYEEITTGHQRTTWNTAAKIVTMKNEGATDKLPFRAVGSVLHERLEKTILERGSAFLYVARRGLSPVTVCRDCGLTVACAECGASVVLHKGREENHFLCHACGALRHARERCVGCRSWRLEALGIGTELVERELTRAFPNTQILTLSSDTSRTHMQATRMTHSFYETRGSILIGTELALPYLNPSSVSLTSVVSLDALLSIPSWSMYERIASTLTRLRDACTRELIVQTRRPETPVLSQILDGNFSSFYRSELKERKRFGYPPYTTILKISAEGTEAEVLHAMEQTKEALLPFELVTFSRFLRAPKGGVMLHSFIRLPRASWPDPVLLAKLRALPPLLTVAIDPENIL